MKVISLVYLRCRATNEKDVDDTKLCLTIKVFSNIQKYHTVASATTRCYIVATLVECLRNIFDKKMFFNNYLDLSG